MKVKVIPTVIRNSPRTVEDKAGQTPVRAMRSPPHEL